MTAHTWMDAEYVEDLLRALHSAKSDARRRALIDEISALTVHFADRAARGYRFRGIELEDLEQVARLGLIKAIRGYDPRRGRGFPAYALPTINGELKRHFRDHGWLVRPSRSMQEARPKIAAAEEALRHRLHREPTVQEVAERLEVDPGMVEDARLATRGYSGECLDHARDGYRPIDPPSPGDPYQELADVDALRRVLPELGERQRTVLRMRFYEDLTQDQIAARIGLSQMQISRILSATLKQLQVLTRAA